MKGLFLLVGLVVLAGCGGGASSRNDVPAGDRQDALEPSGDPGGDSGPPDLAIDVAATWPFAPTRNGDTCTVTNGLVTLAVNVTKGRFSVSSQDGEAVLFDARSEAVFVLSDEGKGEAAEWTLSTADSSFLGQSASWSEDRLGPGLLVRFSYGRAEAPGGTLDVVFHLREGSPVVLARAEVGLPPGASVRAIHPIVARGVEGGGLYLGPGTSRSVVLDDGNDLYFDFVADVSRVGERSSLFSQPGYASNWNAAVCTRERSCVVAGFITSDRAFPLVATDFQDDQARERAPGEEALSVFDLRCLYKPGRKVGADGRLASETGILVFTRDPHAALVEYGQSVSRAYGKALWPTVPASWNSWGGGSGHHGYGQDIDEALILQNLDLAAQDYLPWGMDYFLVDDGWQDTSGYWFPDQSRFPDHGEQNGMAWLAREIEKRGFIPGVWMSPFRVEVSSQLYADHPDWMLETDPIGTAMLGPDTRVLDLSHPGAQAYLRSVMHRVFGEWGYRWLKLDFGYYGLFGERYHDEALSAMEAYRAGMSVVREAIGPDTFFLGIGAMGSGFGIVDGERLTLDNEPLWNDPLGPNDQGIKTTVLTAAHRYYLGNTVWINHPDLLFYRDDFGLTPDEATAFTLFVAIFSGVFKLGESFVFLHEHPDALGLSRRLLPMVQGHPEPLDLFERRWPEVWRLPLEGPDGTYEVFGLFNWGKNRDLFEGRDLPDEDREVVLPLPAGPGFLALDWLAGELLTDGSGSPVLTGPVPVWMKPRTGRIVIVRPADRVFLGTDRHVAGGAVEVASVKTDLTAGVTDVVFRRAIPGEPTHVFFACPAGATCEVLDVSSATLGDVRIVPPPTGPSLYDVTITPVAADARVEFRNVGP